MREPEPRCDEFNFPSLKLSTLCSALIVRGGFGGHLTPIQDYYYKFNQSIFFLYRHISLHKFTAPTNRVAVKSMLSNRKKKTKKNIYNRRFIRSRQNKNNAELLCPSLVVKLRIPGLTTYFFQNNTIIILSVDTQQATSELPYHAGRRGPFFEAKLETWNKNVSYFLILISDSFWNFKSFFVNI